MNYIVGVSEFWLYLVMSFGVGWFTTTYLVGKNTGKLNSEVDDEKEGEFTYRILEKSGQIKAIDTKRNIQADSVIEVLLSTGFKSITSIKGDSEADAIRRYTKFLVKTPLELANETIRLANQRVSSLKKENQALHIEIRALESHVETLKVKSKESTQKGNLKNYQWLGFESVPNKAELKSKYKKLNLIYHPDKGGCGEVMSMINDAYNSLLKVCT